tara:strand:+ start:318 stop:578 length:261 start_codon:yes stop_codon:yes gene_type:complete
MYLLTLKDKRETGVYAVEDKTGHKVLFLFEQEDDAERYAMMLMDDEDNSDMIVIEIDDDLALRTCKVNNYKYAIITENDIIIPPKK